MIVTIIGRGHSGTRAMSHTLSASGFYMGAELNQAGDLIPPEDLYEACRVMARHVTYLGNKQWDFEKLHTMPIDPEFTKLVNSFLDSVLTSSEPNKGWKLPETTLIYPWITRLFPDIHYIYWIRDPRDSILGRHLTDDLSDFGVPCDKVDDEREQRALSWKYQTEIVRNTPHPKNLLTLRFEDFILDQDTALEKLEQYLGVPMGKIEVRPESVGRWKTAEGKYNFDFFHDELVQYGYIDGP